MTQVPSEGPLNCRIAFVGEAPGADEVTALRPFVGRSGSYLTRLMHSCMIDRHACYITNVIKERPPNNEVKHFIRFPDNEFVPPVSTPEYDEYERFLYRELSACSANVIVAVGNVALWALTRKRKVTKYRGSILPSVREIGIRKVIPILHPASLLRSRGTDKSSYDPGANEVLTGFDLRRIVHESNTREFTRSGHVLNIRPQTVEEVLTFLGDAAHNTYRRFAFDVETSPASLQVTCFSVAFPIGPDNRAESMCVPLFADNKHIWSEEDEAAIWTALLCMLANPDLKTLIQNAMFDAYHMKRMWDVSVENVYDTMVSHGIAMPGILKGLGTICSLWTEQAYYKDDSKFEVNCGDLDAFYRYNALDSAVLIEAFPWLQEYHTRTGNIETVNTYNKLIPALVDMTIRGIAVDMDMVAKTTAVVDNEITRLEAEFAEKTGGINPRSPKALAGFLFGDPTRSTKADTLAKFWTTKRGESHRPVLDLLLNIRDLETLRSRYLEINFGDDDRLRGAYNAIGTITGRLSSSKLPLTGEGANVQNQPSMMFYIMKPDDGCVAFEFDYDAAEKWVSAHEWDVTAFVEALHAGKDIHKMTASLVYNKDVADVTQEERDECKAGNYGLDYGMGVSEFAAKYRFSHEKAAFIRGRYFQIYPQIPEGHRKIEFQVRATRTLVDPMGRRHIFIGPTEGPNAADTFKSAYNRVAQGTVGLLINRHGILPIHEHLPEVEILAQIHDALIVQMPIRIGWDRIASNLNKIKAFMEHPLRATTTGREYTIPVSAAMGVEYFDWKHKYELHDIEGWALKRHKPFKERVALASIAKLDLSQPLTADSLLAKYYSMKEVYKHERRLA